MGITFSLSLRFQLLALMNVTRTFMEIWMKHNFVLEVNQAKILVLGILAVDYFLTWLMGLMEKKGNGRLLALCRLEPITAVMEHLECIRELESIYNGLKKPCMN